LRQTKGVKSWESLKLRKENILQPFSGNKGGEAQWAHGSFLERMSISNNKYKKNWADATEINNPTQQTHKYTQY
jgi:hypothetical protein